MFGREDGSTGLIGLNLSSSINQKTFKSSAEIRKKFGLENDVRFEYHVTQPYKGVVRQPYLKRDLLLNIVDTIPNISAKHEGGEPEVESNCEHPSDHSENFRTKEEIKKLGELEKMKINYMNKHDSLNKTAKALTENGFSFIAAPNLHRR